MSRRLEIAVVAIIVVADQVTKAMVRQSLELHESIPVIPDLLALTRVHNTRRGVRDVQRDGLPGQDDRADGGGDAGAGRRRVVCRVGAAVRTGLRGWASRAFWAERLAT